MHCELYSAKCLVHAHDCTKGFASRAAAALANDGVAGLRITAVVIEIDIEHDRQPNFAVIG